MNRKGISPLIAAVLLIAFTVAIATIVMGWMSTTTRDTTQDISDKLGSATDCSNAAVSIQQIIEKSDGDYTVLVSNSGYYNFSTVGATILFTNGSTCTAPTTTLNTGNVGTLTVADCGTGATAASDVSKVVVNTDCGGVTDTVTGSDTSYFEITA